MAQHFYGQHVLPRITALDTQNINFPLGVPSNRTASELQCYPVARKQGEPPAMTEKAERKDRKDGLTQKPSALVLDMRAYCAKWFAEHARLPLHQILE
jgi:hypothetical protein